MLIEVTGCSGHLCYRTLGPEDRSIIWRACAQRRPRPNLLRCLEILSEQLETDAGIDYLERPAADGAVRRFVAFWNADPIALVTATLPAAATGTPALAVDPIGEDLAGNVAFDLAEWLSQLGYGKADVTIYWPEPGESEAFTMNSLDPWAEPRAPGRSPHQRRFLTFKP
ncbi:MAG: hypothetical protein OXG81_11800 [Acidobacteria bacterium]|nr:hypothetical protein [Acidobacteriota bacterium]MCY3971101.1 hypothetical protein [Acidobacteriota bacterium]